MAVPPSRCGWDGRDTSRFIILVAEGPCREDSPVLLRPPADTPGVTDRLRCDECLDSPAIGCRCEGVVHAREWEACPQQRFHIKDRQQLNSAAELLRTN